MHLRLSSICRKLKDLLSLQTCPKTEVCYVSIGMCLSDIVYNTCVSSGRISAEHSPKLQIRSHSYLRAVSEVSINRSLDTLDPKTLLDPKSLLSSPQYRSRNESYMRAMSTISQVGWHHCCLYIYCIPYSVISHQTALMSNHQRRIFEG